MVAKRNFILLTLIGIANGMLPLLIGSTLFVWMKESGLNLASIGLLSLANLPFAFSFALSSLLEYLSYKPNFSYKAALSCSLLSCGGALLYLPYTIHNPLKLFSVCMLLSVASSIVRIILLALQKILFNDRQLLVVINLTTISYKCGMLLAGSLALYLSQRYAWSTLYQFFGGLIILVTLVIQIFPAQLFNLGNQKYANELKLWARLLRPFQNLLSIPQVGLILLLMFCYRAPDNLITHYFDLFYLHYGFSKNAVAFGYKFYGMLIASLGGLCCIGLIRRYSYVSNLKLALWLHLASYLLIYVFSLFKAPLWYFYLCVTSEEFSRGMTMIVFWSFQTHLCRRQHVLVQLAVLTALDSLSYSLLGSIGGGIIEWSGYSNLILLVILSFIPTVFILRQLRTR